VKPKLASPPAIKAGKKTSEETGVKIFPGVYTIEKKEVHRRCCEKPIWGGVVNLLKGGKKVRKKIVSVPPRGRSE